LKGIAYIGYDVTRDNGEVEPLPIEITLARNFSDELKYSKPELSSVQEEFIY
jgi:hypothetical protein